MALNVQEFGAAVETLFKGIGDGIPGIMQIVSNDAVALIKNRIQEKGLDAEEQALEGYSPEYQKRKQEKGRYRGITNLTDTGDMFRKLRIISAGQQGSKYVVTIGGSDEFSQNKIDWNSERYDDILRVAKKEEDIISEVFDAELQKIIDQNGFGN